MLAGLFLTFKWRHWRCWKDLSIGWFAVKDRDKLIGSSPGSISRGIRATGLITARFLVDLRRLLLVEIDLGQVLPDSETSVHLFCSSRSGLGESGQGRISIGRSIKFSFQRVLICLIWSSDEETTPVSISAADRSSASRQRIRDFPAGAESCPNPTRIRAVFRSGNLNFGDFSVRVRPDPTSAQF